MKIKSIAAICKKMKQVMILNHCDSNGTVTQYIGDGVALYPVYDLPLLDEESVLSIFDVPEKQRESWNTRCVEPDGFHLEDTDTSEYFIEEMGVSVVLNGTTLKPFRAKDGVLFVNSKYLAPFSDVRDIVQFFERRLDNGQPYVVAKAGFMIQAVIMPFQVQETSLVQKLHKLVQLIDGRMEEKA